MSILDDSDKLRQSIIDRLTENMPDIEQKIYKRILELLDKFDSSNGSFDKTKPSANKLLAIQNEIQEIITKSGYFKSATLFIQDLNKITKNTIALQSGLNKLTIAEGSLSGIESLWRQKTIQNFNETGLSYNFIQPVTNAITEAIAYGSSIQTTRDNLKAFITGAEEGSTGKLGSYLTTTARDVVGKLQGQQQQAIYDKYEMPWIRVVGNIIKTSSGQCYHWKKMKYIATKDLQNEIDLAKKNQAAKLELPSGYKWSGFDKNTTASNFLVNRGHLGCIDNFIPVRFKT